MMQIFDLIMFKGNLVTPLDATIFKRSASNYTHGAIWVGPQNLIHPKTLKNIEGDIIEATVGGVQLSWISKYDHRDQKVLRYVDPIPEDKQNKMLSWLISKLGCKYEYESFLGYLSGVAFDDPNEYVCVELASEMFTDNGLQVWGAETPKYIYPRDLLINPKFYLAEERKGIPKPIKPVEPPLVMA